MHTNYTEFLEREPLVIVTVQTASQKKTHICKSHIFHFCSFRNFPGNQRPWLPLSRSAANAGWPKFNAAINSDVNQVLHHVFRTRKDPFKEAAVYGIRWQQQDHLAWIHEDDTGQGILRSWYSGVWSKAALQTSPKPLVEDSGRL